jgi:hypothetical protein
MSTKGGIQSPIVSHPEIPKHWVLQLCDEEETVLCQFLLPFEGPATNSELVNRHWKLIEPVLHKHGQTGKQRWCRFVSGETTYGY